jgi:hypothetical protein
MQQAFVDLLTTFERTAFPESECTVQNAREPEVYDAPAKFCCALYDERVKNALELKILSPYVCRTTDDDDQPVTLYGWTDGYNVYDHSERSVHGDYLVVTAWKRV